MGFCLFNNAAVGAAHAIAECGAERVLILDWDVHHGNGTAEIFDRRDDVLYASIHQSPLYPGNRASAARPAPERGRASRSTCPCRRERAAPSSSAWSSTWSCRSAREFDPDLIVVSAGYDAHADDPLANCGLDDRRLRDDDGARCATSAASSARPCSSASRAATTPRRSAARSWRPSTALAGERGRASARSSRARTRSSAPSSGSLASGPGAQPSEPPGARAGAAAASARIAFV